MSSAPPPNPYSDQKQGLGPVAKWVIGCTLGCFALVVLVCGGGALATYLFVKPFVAMGKGMQESEEKATKVMVDVARLDREHPATIPADVATATLTNDEVDRYLRIRSKLQATLGKLDETSSKLPFEQLENLSEKPKLSDILHASTGMLSTAAAASAAHADVLEAADLALEAEKASPTDLARLTEIVEWRFLGRPSAIALGLPELERHAFFRAQFKVRMLEALLAMPQDAHGREGRRADRESELAGARKELEAFETEARQHAVLSPATAQVLEARRADLEAFTSESISVLSPLSANPPYLEAVRGDMGTHRSRHYEWHGGTSGASGAEASPEPEERPAGETGESGATTPEAAPVIPESQATGPIVPGGPSHASGVSGPTSPAGPSGT
jgi:hypothetical protein